jgi:hypothetical protein
MRTLAIECYAIARWRAIVANRSIVADRTTARTYELGIGREVGLRTCKYLLAMIQL